MAQNILLIDDRSTADINASTDNPWRLVTDTVMGGVSQGQLIPTEVEGRNCLLMKGEVKLEYNGGFVQAALNVAGDRSNDLASYTGILLEVRGNDESYNIHLRTSDLWRPWQSYRATFFAKSSWAALHIPFHDFEAHRVNSPLDIRKLKRIGLVAIGREFSAELCIGRVGFYN